MTASQNSFPKSRRYTYVALALGLISAVAVCVALVQVNALERDYGTVRSDILRFNSERQEALGRRDGLLSEISQRSVEADSFRKTIADLTADRERLAAEIKQQTSTLAEGAEKLLASQSQAQQAADTIAAASQAEKTLATLRSQSADIEKKISSDQSKIIDINNDIAEAESKKRAADDALASVDKTRQDRDAEIKRLNGQINDLDDKQRQVADLTAKQAGLASQITKMTKDLADKQRASQDLDASIAKLQDVSAKAKVSAAKTDADIARQESNRADLAKQVSDLETKKASLTGDLAGLTAAAGRAREDVAAAEGRGRAAQDAVSEAEKTLPTLKVQLSDVQADVAASISKRDSLSAELAILLAAKAKFTADKSDADRAASEKATLEKAVSDLANRHTEMRKELELRQADLNSTRAELADLNGRKGVLIQEIAGLNDAKVPKVLEPVTEPAPADNQRTEPAQPATP
ncbi:chromosome segregation protein SMC [Agrobacterium sp. DSM 25558]|uniref:hypothetical protein n=1 Tax=Agrobacterium sp. DSM 25558 TaxID=1907665 RepID=UPI0009726087|nr:hypothetical protein [Agrobacterium sp. DSM 25558]SCX31360.1 chromosome segregation protein SMC [Agrobacterium sp. DSM 25558]